MQIAIRNCFLSCLGALCGPMLVAESCTGLTKLHLADARIVSASVSNLETPSTSTEEQPAKLPRFCRVAALASPSADSAIRIEVWLPAAGWNHRLLSEGNGGYAGGMDSQKLDADLRAGFAAATTDMGTSPAEPMNADVLVGHPEKWADWGYRATHVMTVIAKQVVEAYYGRPPRFAYFRGCSTGGQQGLSEAQRFPEDYNGVLSGAPANNRTRLHIAIMWNYMALEKGVAAGLTKDKLTFLHKEIDRSCNSSVKGRPMHDPSTCKFDPAVLLCSGKDQNSCLNQGEGDAIKDVYTGPVDAIGRSIYPGLALGSESAWVLPVQAQSNGGAPFDSIFRWVYGRGWNVRQFDFSRDVAVVDEKLGRVVNATNPDLSKFEELGHKLVLYHGWADPLIAPQGSIDYFNAVVKSAGDNIAAVARTEKFARLFLVPGMEHCEGGTGPNDIQLLPALIAWVEHGIAPQRVKATRTVRNRVQWTEDLHPYRPKPNPGREAVHSSRARTSAK